jgi:hypothetical protein
VFYDTATSVCSACLRRVEAKLILLDDRVYLDKWCPAHGSERVLVADDAAYWREAREVFLKPAEQPQRFQTGMRWGCPYDCGLCPDHQQHACLTIVDVSDRCNLTCPVCYASSGVHRETVRPLAEIEAMLDAVVRAEGEPDVVQISGGEPTIHPDFWAILDAAKQRPIRHLMVNTNGVEIARDPAFARRLAEYQPGFEVYLQWDSLRDDVLQALRGARLSRVRLEALDHLEAAGVSTTLVVTLAKGLNDDEIGEIIRFAAGRSNVRGVTFQPIQEAGRAEGYDPAVHRLTLTEVRRRIAEQSEIFSREDVIPVPCHPDALAMAYALKVDGQILPLTRFVPRQELLSGPENTIVFERVPRVREEVVRLFSTGIGPEGQAARLQDLLCCLPRIAVQGLTYENVFRVLIIQFADARAYDLRSVKRCCIHFAQPDGRIIPFDTYNLFYRDAASRRALERLRAEAEAWKSQ